MIGLGNQVSKKSDPAKSIEVKVNLKMPHVNRKPLARKHIFVQTPFFTTSKLEQKISRSKTTRFFIPLPVSA